MMRMFFLLVALIALVHYGPQSNAQPFTELIVFGDSHSDTGNWAPGGRWGLDPAYLVGRFSNGPNWVEEVAVQLGLPLPAPSEASGLNYAWGGARTGAGFDRSGGMSFPKVGTQVRQYLSRHVPEPSTYLLCIFGIVVFGLGRLRSRHFCPRMARTFIGYAAIAFLPWTSPLACGQAPSFQLQEATVQEINDAFDSGVLNSERLVQLYLNRIEAYDQQGPALNSIITLNSDALNEARALDVERALTGPRSPLHGIPVLIKDLIDVAGMPTTGGTIALRNSYPPDDSFVTRRLREAGAIILGKTNNDDFGEGVRGRSSLLGQTRNPYDPSRIAGGSSGGTAAAIAANFAVLGLGTDSWGSVRLPASLNSLVGLRPTLGLVSRDGTMAQTLARDTIGPIGRSVEDVAIVMDIVSGFDPADPATSASNGKIPRSYVDALDATGLQGVRIGVSRRFLNAHREIRTIVQTSLDRMRDLGATIVDTFDFQPQADLGNSFYNGFEYHMNNYLESLGDQAPFASVQELVASGEFLPHLTSSSGSLFQTLRGDIPPEQDPLYNSIQQHRMEVEEGFLQAMEEQQVDVFVYPTVASITPTIPTTPFWANFTTWQNTNISPFLGFPSISVPAGFTSNGLPVGIEFLAQSFEESDLLKVAYAYERTTLHRVPPTSTPSLPGETIPEPSAIALAALGLICITEMLKFRIPTI